MCEGALDVLDDLVIAEVPYGFYILMGEKYENSFTLSEVELLLCIECYNLHSMGATKIILHIGCDGVLNVRSDGTVKTEHYQRM